MDRALATIEIIVAVFSGTFSLKEARMEMLPANDARIQNNHQVGKLAGTPGSDRSSPGGPLFCHTSFTARKGTNKLTNGMKKLPTAHPAEWSRRRQGSNARTLLQAR